MDLDQFLPDMQTAAMEERPSVHASIAKDCGFTGICILHCLYAAYGFNSLCDLVFVAMHILPLNTTLNRYLELNLFSKQVAEERLDAVLWTAGLSHEQALHM